MKYILTIFWCIVLSTKGQSQIDSVQIRRERFDSSTQGREILHTSENNKASYPGGESELNNYFRKTIKIPDNILKSGCTVAIEFIIEIDGRLTNFNLVNGNRTLFDSFKQALKKGPRWNPAVRHGRPIRSSYYDYIIWCPNISDSDMQQKPTLQQ